MLAFAFSMLGCTVCDREEPCERADYPLESRGLFRGIAGVAYNESDVIRNGCRECEYTSYSFHLWRFVSEPTDEQIRSTIANEPPDESLRIDDQYAYPLESAYYLICTRGAQRSCALLDVREEVVWTVHFHGGFAVPSPSLRIFRPDGRLDEELPFVFPAA